MTASRRPLPGHPGVDLVSLPAAEAAAGLGPLGTLPYSTRIFAEHALRGGSEAGPLLRALVDGATGAGAGTMTFRPRRILLQDASGIPVLADLLTLQDAARERGGDPAAVTPRLRMDLVVDHALEVDRAGTSDAATHNLARELERHSDRYRFLEFAAERFPGLRVVPPGIGICHQLNLEVFAELVHLDDPVDGRRLAGFDSVLGTDSHTTMVNALSVVGWGVGGIEATAAALGQPVVQRIPEVVGVRLTGALPRGVLATDLALRLTAELRAIGVVGSVVEFCGPGVGTLTVPDRATVANMAPEYGATMAFFPPDRATLAYLRVTGRPDAHVAMVEAYLTAQGMLAGPGVPEPRFARTLDLDLATVSRTMAGPSRPAQRLEMAAVPASASRSRGEVRGGLRDGDVVIAAITSCTNTANPRSMVAAGLLARNAVARGLRPPAWVKTSLTPGSRATSRMLAGTGLQASLDRLGFQVAGHGCATCMGNSGPLVPEVEAQLGADGPATVAVLSGNRNFPGRIHPRVAGSYLASPPLVVAAALAGSVLVDLDHEPVGRDPEGRPVHLHELWPSDEEIAALADGAAATAALREGLSLVPAAIGGRGPTGGAGYAWEAESGVIRRPPFADLDLGTARGGDDLLAARQLLLLPDGVTTDDISPIARIEPASAAGRWLAERGVPPEMFGSFSSRRLNHDVMLLGGFANPRLHNRIAPGPGGGVTRLFPEGDIVEIHEAAERYRERGEPVVVVAGDSYGVGSARDWAAKVTRLLGVRAVLAVGFERIHRINLVALGVLPLQVDAGFVAGLDGSETLDLLGIAEGGVPGGTVEVRVRRGERVERVWARSRVDTVQEAEWLQAGGLLPGLVAGSVSDLRVGGGSSLQTWADREKVSLADQG
ncbi:aconitate hydratase AcnA [Pseudonocardia kunmingensis]|uniref:Aconitase n=1 Tax=Pseudonocardia kunmingensis TaxID=630975 RepID=A0A543DPQ6_9PSEU|nr:aconitate hydratase AcnA [Pseudonocardia kunmingensis]TQM11295.1 aconitase [Pseudonocardia kunmingensis]